MKPGDNTTTIVSKFIELRVQRGWSQGKAANLLGITQQYYNMIEAGHRAPGVNVLKSMAYLVVCQGIMTKRLRE